MLIDSTVKLAPIATIHFGAIAWLVLDRQSLLPTIAFGACLLMTWAVGVLSLRELLRISEFGLHDRQRIYRAYAIAWFLQLAGGVLFYWFMRVHTLPPAFEIMGGSISVTAIFYALRATFGPRPMSSVESGGPQMPRWEIGAAAATITPSAALIGILGCKACGFF